MTNLRIKKFRRKAVDVEVVQFTGGEEEAVSITSWISENGGKAFYVGSPEDGEKIRILGHENGIEEAVAGDFIVRGASSGFYPYNPQVFLKTYEPSSTYTLSDANRMMVYRAFDDGDGNTVTLGSDYIDGYFVGTYGGYQVCSGTEIDGTLYLIVPNCSSFNVLVGDDVVANVEGVPFNSSKEARAYILGLTFRR